MNTNTAIIGALIANPSVFIGKFIAEPLAGAALAYGLVWLFMRPKDGRIVPNPFLWHALGVAAAVAGGAMFRIVAMVTFAGRSAYEPVAETGAAGFYLLIVPAIAAAGYIAWLKTRMAPKSVAASQIYVSAQTAVSKPTSNEPTGNDAFAEALSEIEEGRIDKGTWARAFAESDGDESKAKAFYIKARAESIDGSEAWPDTQPPVQHVPGNRVASNAIGEKAIPASEPTEYYEAALGEKNSNYYIEKFRAFDELGPGLHASWNWAAFFFTGFWSLYRKMYVWFFAWWAVGTLLTVFSKVQNSEINQILGIVVGLLWIAFTLYSNAFYHRKIEARIATAGKTTSDAALVKKRLSAGSGVNAWAGYVFGAIPVIGIVAAVALPAYRDYTRGTNSFNQTAAPSTALPARQGQSFSYEEAVAGQNTPQAKPSQSKPGMFDDLTPPKGVVPFNGVLDQDRDFLRSNGIGGNQDLGDVVEWGKAQLSARAIHGEQLVMSNKFANEWQYEAQQKIAYGPEKAHWFGYNVILNFFDTGNGICKPDTSRGGGIVVINDEQFKVNPVCYQN